LVRAAETQLEIPESSHIAETRVGRTSALRQNEGVESVASARPNASRSNIPFFHADDTIIRPSRRRSRSPARYAQPEASLRPSERNEPAGQNNNSNNLDRPIVGHARSGLFKSSGMVAQKPRSVIQRSATSVMSLRSRLNVRLSSKFIQCSRGHPARTARSLPFLSPRLALADLIVSRYGIKRWPNVDNTTYDVDGRGILEPVWGGGFEGMTSKSSRPAEG
jgi:hypothetical protein